MRGLAKSDLELAQEKIRELKREIRELKHSGSILQENYILLLRDLGEYRVENKEMRELLNEVASKLVTKNKKLEDYLKKSNPKRCK